MSKITDFTTRANSLLLEQLKKQYGPEGGAPVVFSPAIAPAVVSEPAKITDFTTRAKDVIIEQLKKQYGGNDYLDFEIDFNYTAVGGVVSFIPNHLDLDEYDWDFGDGSAHSREVSPVHDYGA